MSERMRIRGGPGGFDAAVIAVVLDRIAREEAAARRSRGKPKRGLPAWVRAVQPGQPRSPGEIVRPD